MRRIITLTALMALNVAIGSPDCASAQGGNVPPVPGPYQAAPAPQTNPYSNPAGGQALPYWMRPQPGQAGRAGAPQPRRSYIPGWVWSPYPPNAPANRPPNRAGQASPQYGAGFWPNSPQPGYGTVPWSPPGYAPNPWPNTPYGAPQYNGAYKQPNQ